MDPMLAERIRRLPAPILAKLATVKGPGWDIVRGMDTYAVVRAGRDRSSRGAWWPTNPVAAIAAVRGWDLATTLEALQVHAEACPEKDCHELALDILEAPTWWANEGRRTS